MAHTYVDDMIRKGKENPDTLNVQLEAENLKTTMIDAAEAGDDPAIIMASMTLATLLFNKGITIEQFEDNYDLYEHLCLESNYDISDKNVDYIYQQLNKVKK